MRVGNDKHQAKGAVQSQGEVRVSERMPKVGMAVPLTARSVRLGLGDLWSVGDGGMTLTCAPVLTKKRRPEE